MNNDINSNSLKDTTSEDRKGIFLATLGIMTIVVAIAGATYAFFAVETVNNNVISGGSAYDDLYNSDGSFKGLNLTITHKTTAASGKMIPQVGTAIQDAVTANCLDGNSNTICKVYQITIKNTSSVKMDLTGSLSLTAASIPNLRWTTGSSATAGFSEIVDDHYTATDTALGTKFSLAVNATQNFWIVIWINETGDAQEDSGTFTGTVTFTGTAGENTGGITSTITG